MCLITAGSLPLSLLTVLDAHLDLISAEKLVWGREQAALRGGGGGTSAERELIGL